MKRATVCLALLVLMGCGGSRPPVGTGLPAWGAAVKGLRVGIGAATASPSGTQRFHVMLENVGDADYVLNLGMMLANGKGPMWPSAIRLLLTKAGGGTRELRFAEGGVAGRVDDFVVCMRAGSTYSLLLSLDDYASPATGEFRMKLEDGSYRIAARFEGRGAESVNLDMQGVSLLNFWTGSAESNVLKFNVGKP